MLRYIFGYSHLQNILIHCKYSCWKYFNKENKLKLLTEEYQAPEKDSVTHTQLGSMLRDKGASTAHVCLHCLQLPKGHKQFSLLDSKNERNLTPMTPTNNLL